MKKFSYLLNPIAFLLLNLAINGGIEQVGKGSFTTDLPSGYNVPSNMHNSPVQPKVTSDFTQLPTSNKWWSSLIWQFEPNNPWSENLYAHPLSYKAKSNGVEVGYPDTVAITPDIIAPNGGHKLQEYHFNHVQDFTVSVGNLSSPDTKVSKYSDWSVTANWADNYNSLQMTIGSGFPFAYFKKKGGPINILFNVGNPTVWHNQNGVIGITFANHHYGFFAPLGSTWNVNSSSAQTNLNDKNYFSVALLPDNTAETLEFFRKHAYAFVTDTKINWIYNEQTSKLTTNYTIKTELMEQGNGNLNQPLTALYRHQWINTKSPLTNYTYISARGLMKLFDGAEWTTELTFHGTLPELPNVAVENQDGYNSKQINDYIDQIYKQSYIERWNGVGIADSYAVAKQLGRLSILIKIASLINHTAARDLFIAEVKDKLEDWLDAKSLNEFFYYDDTWKTLIGYPASFGTDVQINDHHFHWGYFIVAAATIAQFDANWAKQEQWGGMINLLIKDANHSDRSDSRFPFLRYFDAYKGHGWANGPCLFGAGNNQESSSEGINFANAVILWGALTQNKQIRDLGIYLYTTEAESIKEYWFDVNKSVFPKGFDKPTLGILWSNGGAYAIWWGGMVEELHGINFLPITAGSLYLGQYPNYLQLNHDYMHGNANNHDIWTDIHMQVAALYDPLMAIKKFNDNQNYAQEQGESRAHTYYWIHNANALGKVNTAITANYPIATVFNKNGVNNYVAYNTTTQSITVIYSDGTKLSVSPYSYAVSNSKGTQPQFISDITIDNDKNLIVTFTPNWTPQNVTLKYSLNNGKVIDATMQKNSNNQWQFKISKVENNTIINYVFVYEWHGSQISTNKFQYIYKEADQPFKQSAKKVDDSSLEISFEPKLTAGFVDIHYQVNNGTQMNLRMNNANNILGLYY